MENRKRKMGSGNWMAALGFRTKRMRKFHRVVTKTRDGTGLGTVAGPTKTRDGRDPPTSGFEQTTKVLAAHWELLSLHTHAIAIWNSLPSSIF